MTPERFKRIQQCLARRQPDLTVLTDNFRKAHNIAAVQRTADAVGLLRIHAVSPDGSFRHHHMVSGGSRKWVEVQVHSELKSALKGLREDGFTLVAAHPDANALDYREQDYTGKIALLLGSELNGLSEEALASADRTLNIPMQGMVGSLNVSVAAALILYEARRQREAAGLYDECRVDPETCQRLLFEWAYPDLARRCHERGRPYPRLGAEGELLENPLRDVD